MRRRLFNVVLCLSILFLLPSCGRNTAPPPSAAEVLAQMQAAMTNTAQPLPDGLTYVRSAPPSTPEYLTDTMLSALYGEAARGLLDRPDTITDGPSFDPTDGKPPAVGDAAIFLSVAPYPCELAVFRCSDIPTTSTVAALCRGRLDTVARGYGGSEWEGIAKGGRVAVEGCYVFFVVAEDPDAVLARATAFVS